MPASAMTKPEPAIVTVEASRWLRSAFSVRTASSCCSSARMPSAMSLMVAVVLAAAASRISAVALSASPRLTNAISSANCPSRVSIAGRSFLIFSICTGLSRVSSPSLSSSGMTSATAVS